MPFLAWQCTSKYKNKKFKPCYPKNWKKKKQLLSPLNCTSATYIPCFLNADSGTSVRYVLHNNFTPSNIFVILYSFFFFFFLTLVCFVVKYAFARLIYAFHAGGRRGFVAGKDCMPHNYDNTSYILQVYHFYALLGSLG